MVSEREALHPDSVDTASPADGGLGLDITGCDREPIHIPGAIQPHGLLLVADAATGLTVAGAGAIEERLTPKWLDRPLDELLAQDVAHALDQVGAAEGAVVPLATVPGRREAFDATIHRAGDHLIAELETRPENGLSPGVILGRLDAIGTGFERASDLQALCERAAHAFRELTGFARVMIYRFLDDGAGMVVAEDRDPALHAFLNHHFPASDIPRQARLLYVRNRIRVIPDVDYVPAPLRPDAAGLRDLDLSDAGLRSVSPIHVQYLRNMGVTASASISIVKDGLLWGLVACHHTRPAIIPFDVRMACSALAGGFARQVRAKEEAEGYRERIRLRVTEDAIIGRLDDDTSFESYLETRADDVRAMLDADGFAIVQGAQQTRAGVCPSPAELADLARWVNARAAGEPLATHQLGTLLPAAEAYRETASGLLAVTLAAEKPAVLMWFRAEQPEVVRWAGDPHKAATGDAGHLTPRASFADWCETVRGRARRWTRGEVEAASRLRRVLFDLRQARRLRELNRELSLTIAEKDALLVEKEHLLREVNHRVQNSLQLVQAFLGLQQRAENDERLAGHLAEAQRRLSAVALVHRRLYQGDQVETIDLARYLDELVGEMRMSMGPEWAGRIRLDLAPMLISADRAINVGLILTELVINANKYAYGGGAGPIAISLEQYRNQFRMIVADEGTAPLRQHEGFGTRMMNAMVQRLGGEIERYPNQPGLRVIVSAPIEPA